MEFFDSSGGNSIWGTIGDPLGATGGGGSPVDPFTTLNKKLNSTSSTQTESIDEEGMMYLMNSILGSTQGLSAVSGAKNSAGMYDSVTDSLLTNDLVARASGYAASQNKTTSTSGTGSMLGGLSSGLDSAGKIFGMAGGGTVICTHLRSKGILSEELYQGTVAKYGDLNRATLRGYQFWAVPLVARMQKDDRIGKILISLFTPLTVARSVYIATGKRSSLSYLASYVIEPICWILGKTVARKRQNWQKLYQGTEQGV